MFNSIKDPIADSNPLPPAIVNGIFKMYTAI